MRVPPQIKIPSIPLAPASLSPQTTHVSQLLEHSNMLTYCTYTPYIHTYMNKETQVLHSFTLFEQSVHESHSSGFFAYSVCKILRKLSSQIQHATAMNIHHCTCLGRMSDWVCTCATINVLHSRSVHDFIGEHTIPKTHGTHRTSIHMEHTHSTHLLSAIVKSAIFFPSMNSAHGHKCPLPFCFC